MTTPQKTINIYIGSYRYDDILYATDGEKIRIKCFDRLKSNMVYTQFTILKTAEDDDLQQADEVYVQEQYTNKFPREEHDYVKKKDMTIRIVISTSNKENFEKRTKIIEILKEYGFTKFEQVDEFDKVQE